MKNSIQKITFLTLLIVPTIIFSQSIEDLLSPESQIAIQQAKKSKKSSKKTSMNDMVNIALTTQFSGNMIFKYGLEYCTVNSLTSLELFLGKNTARFLMTGRVTVPVLYTMSHDFMGNDFWHYDTMSRVYVGLGIGTSITIMDNRNDNGVGGMLVMNLLFTSDFSVVRPIANLFEAKYGLDWGIRYNHFVAKRFAFVIGLSVNIGSHIRMTSRKIGDDTYPTIPLENYGALMFGEVSIGTMIGFMF